MLELEVASLNIRNPGDTFKYDILPGAIAADRILTLPVITGTDTLMVLGLAQTVTAALTFDTADLSFNDSIALTLGTGGDVDIEYDGTDLIVNARVVGTGNVDFRQHLTWGAGVAITAGDYAIGRNADGTNLLQLNVPTGASLEVSVNDVAMATFSAAGLALVASDILTVDTINEVTSAGGVTVDGLLIKDSEIPLTGLDIDGGTDIAGALAAADLIIIDDGAGGTNKFSALSRVETLVGVKEFFCPVLDQDGLQPYVTEIDTYMTSTVTSTEQVHFNFFVPANYSSLLAAVVIIIPDVEETVQWDVSTTAAASDQDSTTHSDTETNATKAVQLDQMEELDISAAFSLIAANDYVGVLFASDTSDLRIVGMRFKYAS